MNLDELNQRIKALGVGESLRLENVPDEVYHASEGFGSSKIKSFMASPLKFKWEQNHPIEQSPAMIKGSAFHCAVLEPDRYNRDYAVAPAIDKRTKKGKEEWAEFQASCEGKTIIDAKLAEEVNHMVDSCLAQFGGYLSDFKPEVSYWRRHRTGLVLKARIDAEVDRIAYDLKSTKDPLGFDREAVRYDYHIQATHYGWVSQLAHMVFLPTGNSAPFISGQPVEFSPEDLNDFYPAWAKAIDELSDALDFDEWSAPDNTIKSISIPAWKLAEQGIAPIFEEVNQ